MSKWNLIVDVAECTNCNMCVLACHDEYVGNDWPGYSAAMPKHGHRWIDIQKKERGQAPMVDVAYLPVMCQHCDDAPCLKAARDGAVKKREDGIVLIDPVKAKGQRQIVDACPYGAIYWNEEKQIPQHWTFDAHLLDQGWKEPRAAQSCPTAAITALKTDDAAMEAKARAEGLEPLYPEHGTKPRVWYKNLHRFSDCFVGGSLAIEQDGVTDCVGGAKVTLSQSDRIVAEAVTDGFGDFKIDRVPPHSGRYSIAIAAPGRAPKTLECEIKDESVYLGTILV
jgi:Fe-S-cluster-containing dehydrogenase component